MGPFEKIRKHAIYDIHGSAFACSFPGGGGGCKSVRTLGGGGSGKVLPATGGGRISNFFAYILYGRPLARPADGIRACVGRMSRSVATFLLCGADGGKRCEDIFNGLVLPVQPSIDLVRR